MHLSDVVWATSDPSYVTPVSFDGHSSTVLVERAYGPSYRYDPDKVKAFVLSNASDEGLTINGLYVDLGESTQDFRNILDEADNVAALGQTYLSDPYAADSGRSR